MTAKETRAAIQTLLAVKPDSSFGPKTDAAYAALRIADADSQWPVAPVPTDTFDGIIDIYWREDVSLAKLKAAGVAAILHKATEGTSFKDRLYHARKAEAESLGILWGSYHFSSGANPALQAKHYLDFTVPQREDVMCLDFEPSSSGPDMTAQQARTFVEYVHDQTGRWPMIYGGHMIREELQNVMDSVFRHCPLWYCRYGSSPKGVPDKIWPNGQTLWQFTDGHIGPEPHQTAGYNLDRNQFRGNEADLRTLWPFS